MTLGRELKISIAVALTVYIIYLLCPFFDSGDSDWYWPTAISLVREGNFDIDEFSDHELLDHDYRIQKVNGHYYMQYPISLSLLLVPFVIIHDGILLSGHQAMQLLGIGSSVEITSYMDLIVKYSYRMGVILGSFFTAMAALIIFRIARKYLNMRYSLLLTGAFAFATSAWSVASRAMWQHGPSMFLLSLALLFLIRAQKDERWVKYTGFILAYAYFIRPTNVIPAMFFTLYILLYHRRRFLVYGMMALPVFLFFFYYNFITYGAVFPKYFTPHLFDGTQRFTQALIGHVISPARGLLVFSPIFLFSLAGIYLKISRRQLLPLDFFLLAIMGSHWLLISYFPHWWGGHSYGPRLWADMVPFFCYFLIPFFNAFGNLPFKRVVLPVFAVLLGLSIFIHSRGAFMTEAVKWNQVPANVDKHPERLWDWSDLQFLRGLF
ncbi:MAG: hypothetical protein C4524_09430 [Candidatus Zixiibacteriota bacterium]|nr:MAG: hypothetical protein C4524_09430 [candidate division Zixibacteria bacterium]